MSEVRGGGTGDRVSTLRHVRPYKNGSQGPKTTHASPRIEQTCDIGPPPPLGGSYDAWQKTQSTRKEERWCTGQGRTMQNLSREAVNGFVHDHCWQLRNIFHKESLHDRED